MTLRHTLEYAGLLSLSWLLRALPRRLALDAGAGLGQAGWWLGIRRAVVLTNLRQALPSVSEPERRRVAARAARNFGRTVTELIRFAGRDRRRVGELVAFEGIEELRGALAGGAGAIVVTGHLGAWALYVAALSAAGVPSALLIGRQHNERVDAFIRAIPGDAVTLIPTGPGSTRGCLESLRAGRAVVMVADQHVVRGEVAPFLGRPAATLSLPGAFAARRGVPLMVMAGHRVERGRHVVRLARVDYAPSPDEAELRREITAACNAALGEAILAHPDQYFWYHRRWRD